ncbi:hypothetical protein BC828DRAFT_139640 [Blastocladiella britannica]|nr:hypothetical protein BC828DRAFT_139640 [Blastocladiella britannica]
MGSPLVHIALSSAGERGAGCADCRVMGKWTLPATERKDRINPLMDPYASDIVGIIAQSTGVCCWNDSLSFRASSSTSAILRAQQQISQFVAIRKRIDMQYAAIEAADDAALTEAEGSRPGRRHAQCRSTRRRLLKVTIVMHVRLQARSEAR